MNICYNDFIIRIAGWTCLEVLGRWLRHADHAPIWQLGVHTVKIIRYGTGTVYFIRF